MCNLRSGTIYDCSRNWPGCSLDLRCVVLCYTYMRYYNQRCQETGNREAASQPSASVKAFPSV